VKRSGISPRLILSGSSNISTPASRRLQEIGLALSANRLKLATAGMVDTLNFNRGHA